jgi:hypothetical protein
MAARLATGEIEESPKPKSNRTKSGNAGGKARAESLLSTSNKRFADGDFLGFEESEKFIASILNAKS